MPPDLIRHDKRPRILGGHDRPLSRPNSHGDHRGIKVGSAGRLRIPSCLMPILLAIGA